MVIRVFLCMSFGEHTCTLLLSMFLEVEMLEPRICVFSGLADTTNCITYPSRYTTFTPHFFLFTLTAEYESPRLPCILVNLDSVCLFHFNYSLVSVLIVSHWVLFCISWVANEIQLFMC